MDNNDKIFYKFSKTSKRLANDDENNDPSQRNVYKFKKMQKTKPSNGQVSQFSLKRAKIFPCLTIFRYLSFCVAI